MSNTGFIQIYQQNYACTTVDSTPTFNVLVIGERQYLMKDGPHGDTMFFSQMKNIHVLETMTINDINIIFMHSRDRVLDAYVKDSVLIIVGDGEVVLFRGQVSPNVPANLNRGEIILKASKPWLNANRLFCF